MSTQAAKRRVRSLGMATLVLILIGAVIVPATLARIMRNTIDPVARISDNGRRITITGPVRCDQTEWADQRVTVTQRETGAVAEGSTRFTCTVDDQQWQVDAVTQGAETFQEGPATAVAFCRSTIAGHATDAHQWLVEITLVRE